MRKSLNLCIISQYWLPDLNGDVTRLKNCIETLLKLNYNISLITSLPHFPYGYRKGYKEKLILIENWNKIKVIRFYVPPISHEGLYKRLFLYLFFSFISSFGILFIKRADYVWAFSQRIFSSFTALFFKIFKKSKIIVDMTDLWPEALVNTGYISKNKFIFKVSKFLSKIVYILSDKITVLTFSMKKYIVKEYKIREDKIKILPNITEKIFNSNIQRENSLFIYSGNLGTNYDLLIILKAAKLLKDKKKIKFLIRGKGEMFYPLIKALKEYNLNNVKIIHEYLKDDEYLSEMQKASGFILPLKKYEFPDASFPIKFVDYLKFKKPIILIAEGYIAELTKKEKIGFVIKPGDYKSLAKIISSIENEKEYIEKIKENSEKLIEKMFSRKILEKELPKIFT